MKPLIFILVGLTCSVLAQGKPRVFVQGKGSQDVTTSSGRWSSRSTIDSHDEGMEVTKDLQKNCAGAIVTLTQSNADYTVILNRESKHNRGLLRTNSQIQVANRLGDILGTNATRTVGNASKDACQLILADWSQHGRIPAPDSPASAPAPAPVAPAIAPAPADGARIQTISAVQSQPTTAVAETPIAVAKADDGGGAPADAATNSGNPARTSEATAEISSEPSGADIEIDGSFVGSTPSSLAIAAGEHTLNVSKNGYKPWRRTLKSSAGNIKIVAGLEPAPVASARIPPADAQTRDTHPSEANQLSPSVPSTALPQSDNRSMAATTTAPTPEPATNSPSTPPEEALIGVSFAGNPTVRHDGVEVSGVQTKGPANDIDIRPGDILLAIDAHYFFTIDEVRAELVRYKPGVRVLLRYRRNQFISENYLTLR
jgi:hypothetical protein